MLAHQLLEDLARRTWHRLRDGNRLGIRQGETGLTDYLLLEIVRAGLASVKVIKTPLHSEASQGTDWEWWIGSTRLGWIRYAIQAKRLRFPNDYYDAIGHRVNGRLQVDLLMAYAAANRAVALYCLFNCTDDPKAEDYWQCNLDFELEQLGCTVAPAKVVKQALSAWGGRTFQAIHSEPGVLPWRCLVYCPAILAVYRRGTKGDKGSDPAAGFPFGDFPTVHPALPRDLRIGMETGELERFNDDFFNGDPESFPRYLAIIDISEI